MAASTSVEMTTAGGSCSSSKRNTRSAISAISAFGREFFPCGSGSRLLPERGETGIEAAIGIDGHFTRLTVTSTASTTVRFSRCSTLICCSTTVSSLPGISRVTPVESACWSKL